MSRNSDKAGDIQAGYSGPRSDWAINYPAEGEKPIRIADGRYRKYNRDPPTRYFVGFAAAGALPKKGRRAETGMRRKRMYGYHPAPLSAMAR